MANLPTLDFSKFYLGSDAERKTFSSQLVQSFHDHGFVKLINHGMTNEATSGFLRWAKEFFQLPKDVKEDIVCVRGPHLQRGWSRVGWEQTSRLRKENFVNRNPDELTDEREHFDAGPLDDPYYPNKWPRQDAAPGFREYVEDTYEACQKLSLEIMAAIELGLGARPGTLVERCQDTASEIRLNRYPPVSVEKLADGRVKRTWPHTDFGLITLLLQDHVGGLELEDRAKPGTFAPVVPGQPDQPSELVVNISDAFQRWTNDVFTAALHQVSAPAKQKGDAEGILPERYSLVFFFKQNRDVSAGPLPEFVSAGNPARYPEETALEYQRRRTTHLY